MRHVSPARGSLGLVSVGLLLAAFASPAASAQTPSFTDVPPDHAAFPAIEYLRAKGYVSGYSDGTFRPDQFVTRAEAAKLIVAPVASARDLAAYTTTAYTDVPEGMWYLPFVAYARQVLKIVDGPPAKTTFRGADPVLQAEFLKMFLLAQGADPNAYGEIQLPLSSDVPASEWHHPYHRYAISSSMIFADERGLLMPGKKLTRGDTALQMYRYFRYKENRRTQALLTETEQEILRLLERLGVNDIAEAEHASVRALLAARGAHASRPDAGVVVGAVKVAEAFRALVRAYHAGLDRDYDAVIALTGKSWRISDEALAASAELQPIVDQLHRSAKSMADSARVLTEQ